MPCRRGPASSTPVEASTIGLGLVAVSLCVHVVTLAAATRARLRAAPPLAPAHRRRSVSILKPLAGEDDELSRNLESFAAIAHPDFEILLGVASPDDPAAPIARAFMRRHTELRARLVVTDPRGAQNPKVSQLIGLAAQATGEILVVSDSNVRVTPDYLARLDEAFAWSADPRTHPVGLVTSLFVGRGERSLGAALENLHLTTFVAPAVATSALFARPFTVGKSMAIAREALSAIGGFEAGGHELAEDHLLGRRIGDAGFAVRVSFAPVENRNVDCDVSRTVERHTRWAKMRRAIAPVPFLLEPLADPLLLALVFLALLPSTTSALVFASLVPFKMATSAYSSWLLRGTTLPWRYLPLELIKSVVMFFCWARALVSLRIVWRGHPFALAADSRLMPLAVRRRRPRRA